jgi:hypothetical protein
MKTRTLFFALLLAVSTSAFAGNDEPGLTVVSFKGSEVFKVIYKGTNTGRLKLNILNDRGDVIHSESISGLKGFICPVNFKGLESGDYTIEVIDKNERYRESITYKPAHELKSIHVSKIQSEDGKYLLAVANANEPIHVRIFDEDQRLLYNESKTLKGDFAQVYKLPGGYSRYTFEVSDDAGNRKYFNF